MGAVRRISRCLQLVMALNGLKRRQDLPASLHGIPEQLQTRCPLPRTDGNVMRNDLPEIIDASRFAAKFGKGFHQRRIHCP
jgi:hypothetical protein